MKKLYILIAFLTLLISCDKSPQPIDFGSDLCDNCKMTIADSKWGAELITEKGKAYKFDSIECMAFFYLKKTQDEGLKVGSFWTVNFNQPKELININNSFYLKCDSLRSPMGLNVVSFKSEEDLNNVKSKFSGDRISWEDVIRLVKTEW